MFGSNPNISNSCINIYSIIIINVYPLIIETPKTLLVEVGSLVLRYEVVDAAVAAYEVLAEEMEWAA